MAPIYYSAGEGGGEESRAEENGGWDGMGWGMEKRNDANEVGNGYVRHRSRKREGGERQRQEGDFMPLQSDPNRPPLAGKAKGVSGGMSVSVRVCVCRTCSRTYCLLRGQKQRGRRTPNALAVPCVPHVGDRPP